MAEHDLKGDKLQINSIESKEIVRIAIKNILTYSEGFTLGDFDLIHKQAVEEMIAASPGYGNRFPTIIWTDDNDVEIARTTTDKNKLLQFFSVTGELLFQLGPTNYTPPVVVIAPDLDIAWTLSENQPDFLDLNFNFRAADGSILSDHGNEGSGLIGDGGIKPKSGELLRVELSYYGGLLDSNDNLVSEWDGPVKVTLEIRKNGVWFDGYVKEYPTPPAVGSLGAKYITPNEFETWTTSAKAERYTPVEGDETGSVDSPPEIVITKSLIGGSETISGGVANVKYYSDQSTDPDGDPITREWIFDYPGVIITPI